MSSLNPFAARRERGEAKMREKIADLQAQQELQDGALMGGGGGDGASPMLTESQLAAMLPDRSGGYDAEDLDKYLPATAKTDQPATDWSSRAGSTTYEPPTRARQCFHRLQNAFMIGASLGGAVGFMYGAYAAVAYKHVLYLPIAVVQAAGGFGFFLACGTVIRCEEAMAPGHEPLLLSPVALEMAARGLVEPLAAREHHRLSRRASAASSRAPLALSGSALDALGSAGHRGAERSAVLNAVMLGGGEDAPRSRWLA